MSTSSVVKNRIEPGGPISRVPGPRPRPPRDEVLRPPPPIRGTSRIACIGVMNAIFKTNSAGLSKEDLRARNLDLLYLPIDAMEIAKFLFFEYFRT